MGAKLAQQSFFNIYDQASYGKALIKLKVLQRKGIPKLLNLSPEKLATSGGSAPAVHQH